MLDWYSLQEQVERYVAQRRELEDQLAAEKRDALSLFTETVAEKWEWWRGQLKDIEKEHSLLIPDCDENPAAVYDVSGLPSPPIVLSTDGSQIFPSRHESAPVALVAVSQIRLNYADVTDEAVLTSAAQVFVQDEIAGDLGDGIIIGESSFEDLVSDRRTRDELKSLAELSVQTDQHNENNHPLVALSDGSLILWRLAGRNLDAYEKAVVSSYTENLSRFAEINVPVAGYISHSGSRELVHLLLLVEMIQKKQDVKETVKTIKPMIKDTMLFGETLNPNQRSTVFRSQSKILKAYGKNRIYYFYLNTGDEVAKIEIPEWVAKDAALIDHVAAVCLQQCELGGGYPIILSEAHEQAVVRGIDRETFYAMVEQEMLRQGMMPQLSAKQRRKNNALV